MLVFGCAQKEKKLTDKPTTANVEKPQPIAQNIKENISNSRNQKILDEIADTKSLDSALEELDSVE